MNIGMHNVHPKQIQKTKDTVFPIHRKNDIFMIPI